MFGHTFYSWPTFYCAGYRLFTACLVLCLNIMAYIQYTFYYFWAIKSTLYSVFYKKFCCADVGRIWKVYQKSSSTLLIFATSSQLEGQGEAKDDDGGSGLQLYLDKGLSPERSWQLSFSLDLKVVPSQIQRYPLIWLWCYGQCDNEGLHCSKI